jgi:hypothetical protein
MSALDSDTRKPATSRRGQPDVASLPDEQSAVTVVPSHHEIIAVFGPDGRKVAFISRAMLDPVKISALLEWGGRNWVTDRRLARKWRVALVFGDRSWCGDQNPMDGDLPPTGLRFAFL